MKKLKKVSGQLVDLFQETIYPAVVEIENGRIATIRRQEKVDGPFLIPGFVDAHVHIESSMLPPSEFARFVLPHGIISTVSDPHEIGNVLGVKGVEYMIENASQVPLKFYFGAPSCVPATNFETSGACLSSEEIHYLLSKSEIKYLAEVMNFPDVISREPEMMAKIKIAQELHKKIDGHAPQLKGDDLKKYVSAGIDTDHECTSVEEAKAKIALGMKILIREGSAAHNFDSLFPLLLECPESCMLCSDDIDPKWLLSKGVHDLVKKSIARGADLMSILRCVSLNPVQHYGLEVGLLQIGDPADFIEVDNLTGFPVRSTYIDGECVAKDQKVLFPRKAPRLINHFAAEKKEVVEFVIPASSGRMRVIEATEDQLLTKELLTEPLLMDGFVVSDCHRDLLKIAVVNRYQNKPPSVGMIKSFGLKRGAIASSVAHDSHNIIAVGVSDEELCRAINCIVEHRGGLCVVDGEKAESLSFPIAGLMSDQEGTHVAMQYKKLEELVKSMGCPLKAPFMTLSFMALLVIPQLKISDLGLFDGQAFNLTSLFESA